MNYLKEYPEWSHLFVEKVMNGLIEHFENADPKRSQQENEKRREECEEYIEELKIVDRGNCIRWLNRALKYLNNTFDFAIMLYDAINAREMKALYFWEPDEHELKNFGGQYMQALAIVDAPANNLNRKCLKFGRTYERETLEWRRMDEECGLYHLAKRLGL